MEYSHFKISWIYRLKMGTFFIVLHVWCCLKLSPFPDSYSDDFENSAAYDTLKAGLGYYQPGQEMKIIPTKSYLA